MVLYRTARIFDDSGKLKSDPAETFTNVREEEGNGAEDASKEDEDSTDSSESSEGNSEGMYELIHEKYGENVHGELAYLEQQKRAGPHNAVCCSV